MHRLRSLAALLACSGLLLSVSACEAAQQQGAEPEIEQVATSPHQWTGIGVTSSGRIYVNFPRWSDDVPISVGYLAGDGGVLPFPDAAWNSWEPGESDFSNRFVAVQSVVAVGDDVWVLDTGRPRFGQILPDAPRLFRFDGDGRKLTEYPVFGAVKPTSYLNDVRFSADGSRAYITDSGAGGLVVIDLETGAAHRALDGHPSTMATGTRVVIDGTPWGSDEDPPRVHADGIALFGEHLYFQALTARTLYRVPLQLLERDVSAETRATGVEAVAEVGPSDGTPWGSDDNPPQVHADGIALFGEHLYFQALTARTLYRVPLQLLERDVSAETRATGVEAVAEVGPSDGLIAGPDGSIYLSSLEHNAVRVLRPDGSIEVVAQDPLIAWPDSFSFGPDGSLYVTTSRIHQGPVPPAPYAVLRISAL